MKYGEWWFESSPKNKKVLGEISGGSADVIFKMCRDSLRKGKANSGGGRYVNFGPHINENMQVIWRFQLDNNEIFYVSINPSAISETEQLIIAHNWGKEGK